MDDATAPETTARAPIPRVEAEDVSVIYNLLLRRDPESQRVVEAQRGRPLMDFFHDILNSQEFYSTILPAVAGRAKLPPYRGARSFDRLRTWIRRRSCFPPQLNDRLVACLSWRELYRTLLGEAEVTRCAPKLKGFDIESMLALSNAPAGASYEFEDLEGDCDYINIWEIKGWCIDRRDGSGPSTVDILLDGEVVGTAVCQEYRRDVQGNVGGDGACGFTFIIPPAVREALREERWVEVRERSTGAPIGGPVAVRNYGPSRVDQLDNLEAELGQAKKSLERLEARMAQASGALGYHLAAYDEFARARTESPDEAMAERYRAMFHTDPAPLMSIVLVLDGGHSDAAADTLRSISNQFYPHWEVVIVGLPRATPKRAITALAASCRNLRILQEAGDAQGLTRAALDECSGEFVLFLSPGDLLNREALLESAITLRHRGAAAVYADEDAYERDDGGAELFRDPRLKPDIDPDYLLSTDYIGRLVVFERAAAREAGGLKYDPDQRGILDLVLRLIETRGPDAIAHCPRVLYHTPPASADSKVDEDPQAACRVVNEHFARTGSDAVAEPHDDPDGGALPDALRIRWPLPTPPPGVSIIIPTKDHPELIGPCLLSITAAITDYAGAVELLVVDNGTSDPIALALLDTLADTGAIRLARYPGPFNWSALNNRAVTEARGEVLIFLNNDIVMRRPGWLSELVSQALRPQVGAVGARLLYEDLNIQHAGMVLGVAGAVRHESIGQAVTDGGYLGRTQLQHRTSAVTGACLATRRKVFEQVGGFDEAAFKIVFNDTDYCMKVTAAGLAIVYSPFATMLHFESASRNASGPEEAGEIAGELAIFRDRWREALRNDPYYNPHFERAARPFSYLAAPR